MSNELKVVKVLHITNAYPYEGTPEYGVFVKEQIESLPSRFVQSEVVFINGREGGKRAYLRSIFEVRSKLSSCDVVHCHHLYSFIVAMLAGVVGKRPVVLSFLNDWTQEVKDIPFFWLRSLICGLSVRLSSKVVFKSPIPNHLRLFSKVVNLPNGVDEVFFKIRDRSESRRVIGVDDDACYLLFVSSKNKYREQKRYDIFRNVVACVQEKLPGKKVAEYVMVGQSRDMVPFIFSSCDVHVLTSDYEGSPNSVKESLCCGTPVVSRDVGNVREMLEGVEGGEVIDGDNVENISSAIVRIISNSPKAEDVRSSFLEKGITKKRIAERLVNIYGELVS